jgi:hypothetical protein
MSLFTKPLIVTPFSDGKTWRLTQDFGFAIGSEDSEKTVDVPAGFATDFASVPCILWIVLPKWGKYGNAAVIHDYLYYEQSTSRLTADNIFLEGMMVLDVPRWKRYCLYSGVRIGGWWAWWVNGRKKVSGYSKITSASPAKAVEQPLHWKTNFTELTEILQGKKTPPPKADD